MLMKKFSSLFCKRNSLFRHKPVFSEQVPVEKRYCAKYNYRSYPTSTGYFLLTGGNFKCHKFEEWWVALCSWVCAFVSILDSMSHHQILHLYLGKKTRPYVKTLPMPKCLSPATPNPDLPMWVHRWSGQQTGSACRLATWEASN